LRNNNQGVVKLLSGYLKPNKNAGLINIDYETSVAARVDGGQRIGMAVVSIGTEIAIKKAKNSVRFFKKNENY